MCVCVLTMCSLHPKDINQPQSNQDRDRTNVSHRIHGAQRAHSRSILQRQRKEARGKTQANRTHLLSSTFSLPREGFCRFELTPFGTIKCIVNVNRHRNGHYKPSESSQFSHQPSMPSEVLTMSIRFLTLLIPTNRLVDSCRYGYIIRV